MDFLLSVQLHFTIDQEKKYYFDKMTQIAEMAEHKDSEGKGFKWKMLTTLAVTAVAVIGVAASLLGGNSEIKIPRINE